MPFPPPPHIPGPHFPQLVKTVPSPAVRTREEKGRQRVLTKGLTMKIVGALLCNRLIPQVMALYDMVGVGQVLLRDGVDSLGHSNGCRG